MSRFTSMPRAGWFAAGVAVAILLVPTAVGATVGVQTALRLTGIEGTSGNEADVSGAGQLLTTEAAPTTYVQTTDVFLPENASNLSLVTQPTGNHALIITAIHVNIFGMDDGAGKLPAVGLQITPGSTCPGGQETWAHTIDPASFGEIDIPYAPGLVVAKGSALCGAGEGDVNATVTVSGYLVPSADAPTSS
jgi:hypothetical protein